jgi:hypothetical protein
MKPEYLDPLPDLSRPLILSRDSQKDRYSLLRDGELYYAHSDFTSLTPCLTKLFFDDEARNRETESLG